MGEEQCEIWRQRCDIELDNLRVGMEWMVDSGQLEWAIRVSVALEPYWYVRGWPEWLTDLRVRLFHLPLWPSSPTLWRVVASLAGSSDSLYRPEGSATRQHTSRQQAGESVDPALQATVLIGLGGPALYNDAIANARGCFDEALEISRRIENDSLTAGALSNLATLNKHEGDVSRARQLYVESRELFARVGDSGAVAWSYNFEADAARQAGDLNRAEALLHIALQQFQESEDVWGIGSCQSDLARVASDRWDFAEAEARYRGGLRMFQRIRHRGGIRRVLEGLALTAAARQEHGRALRLAGAAAAMWHEYPVMMAADRRTRASSSTVRWRASGRKTGLVPPRPGWKGGTVRATTPSPMHLRATRVRPPILSGPTASARSAVRWLLAEGHVALIGESSRRTADTRSTGMPSSRPCSRMIDSSDARNTQ